MKTLQMEKPSNKNENGQMFGTIVITPAEMPVSHMTMSECKSSSTSDSRFLPMPALGSSR